MRNRNKVGCAAAVVAALVVALPVSATTATAVDGNNESRQKEASVLRQDLDAVVAGGPTSALVEVRGARRTVRATSGTAVAGTRRPVDPAGRFRAGSVTKAFVATTVLQLVDEDLLDLDGSVDRWLPGLVPDGDRITVRELLNHTSGLPDVTDTLPLKPPTAFLPIRYRTWTTTELVHRATAQPPVFEPGASYHYSSTDYLVLGLLIERVTGHSYAHEISHRILRPLNMEDTLLPGTKLRIPGSHAHNYIPDGAGGVVDITEMNPSVMNAAGELISSAADLNTFTTALLGGRLLPPKLLREMMTISEPSQTGLGLQSMATPCGAIAYGHDGDALGSSTWTFATPGGRAVTLSVAWGTGRPAKEAVTNLLEDALCHA
ncbi:serine hydrolase domain-containing protein [Streptomyces sp. NPDC102467]|uniref:serine hydrolase domain-containing protein n=1 Tax=Streptomyces sp. NPDC102467 TaxID=3366179 RepID=UPI00380F1BEE